MPISSLRRKTALLLLTSLLALPWAATATPRAESPRRAEAAASAFLDVLARAWSFLTGVLNKEGCNIDPNGRCIPGAPPSTIQTDAGCNIDPNGRCGS
jgi:hypothetical protein